MQQRAAAKAALLAQRGTVREELWQTAAPDSDNMWIRLPHELETPLVDLSRANRQSNLMTTEALLSTTLRLGSQYHQNSASRVFGAQNDWGRFSEYVELVQIRLGMAEAWMNRHGTINPLSALWCAWSVLMALVANIGLFVSLYQVCFQPWDRLWNQILDATIEALWILDMPLQVRATSAQT
jgi:hypothetical protein